jgi:hypothetical protein
MSLQHYINYILTYSIILKLTRITYINNCETRNTGGGLELIMVYKIKHVLDMFYGAGKAQSV